MLVNLFVVSDGDRLPLQDVQLKQVSQNCVTCTSSLWKCIACKMLLWFSNCIMQFAYLSSMKSKKNRYVY